MAQIKIILDDETILKLDACARFRRISREHMLRQAIDMAMRSCYEDARVAGIKPPVIYNGEKDDNPGGILSRQA